jgi:hypothetical protein
MLKLLHNFVSKVDDMTLDKANKMKHNFTLVIMANKTQESSDFIYCIIYTGVKQKIVA